MILRGGSLLTVSLKSCRGESILQKGGVAVRQLEVSACRSGFGLTLRRACPCFKLRGKLHRKSQKRFEQIHVGLRIHG